jgi:hypothetical protein
MRTRSPLLFALFFFTRSTAFSQQLGNSNDKYPVYIPDTSEQGMVKQFNNVMEHSETVIAAQEVSREPKRHVVKDELFPNGHREIYTEITFKVFQWIKGSIRSDSVIFYQNGGKIGDTEEVVTSYGPRGPVLSRPPSKYFFQKTHGSILFLGNKDQNTNMIKWAEMPIYDWADAKHGVVFVGSQKVNLDDYVAILKQSVSDTTIYPKYIHMLKARR